MDVQRSFAGPDDRDDLAQFDCWDGNPEEPWADEAQNYVRAWVLSKSAHTIVFKDADGQIVGVSAFSPRLIGLPLVQPVEHPAWHVDVVAVVRRLQGNGFAQQIFAGTFEAMQQCGPDRILATANVHRNNARSLSACAKAGLHALMPLDDHYWILLGEVP